MYMYVCMFSSCLYFYSCQGEIIPKAVITHHVEASVFDWHPLERILAIGWADGTIHGIYSLLVYKLRINLLLIF